MSLEKLYQEQKALQKKIKDLCIKIETVQNENLRLKLKAELDEAENSLVSIKEKIKYENANPKNQNGLTEYVPQQETVVVSKIEESATEEEAVEEDSAEVADEEIMESGQETEDLLGQPAIRDPEEAYGINYHDLYLRYNDAKKQGDTELMQNLFRVIAKGADREIGEAVLALGSIYYYESNKRQKRKGIELCINAARKYGVIRGYWMLILYYWDNHNRETAKLYIKELDNLLPEKLANEHVITTVVMANFFYKEEQYLSAYRYYKKVISYYKNISKWCPETTTAMSKILRNYVVSGINIGEIEDRPEVLEPLLRPIIDTNPLARNQMGRVYFDMDDYSNAIPYFVRNEGNEYARNKLLIIHSKLKSGRERSSLEEILNTWAENDKREALIIYKYLRSTYSNEKNKLKELIYIDKEFHISNRDGAYSCYQAYQKILDEYKNKDPYDAIRFLEEASEADVSLVNLVLGHIYFNGRVISRDFSKALKYYTKAEYTAENCQNGIRARPRDCQEVGVFVGKAKRMKQYEEQYQIALQNLNNENFNDGFDSMLDLARNDYGPALYQVARIYDSEYKVKQVDDKTIINYYLRSAGWGHTEAIHKVIEIYKNGYRGQMKDLDEAKKWEQYLNRRRKSLWD